MVTLLQQFEKYVTLVVDQLAPYEADLVSQYHTLMSVGGDLKLVVMGQMLEIFQDNRLMTALSQNDVDKISEIFDSYSSKYLFPGKTFRNFTNRMDDSTREFLRKNMLILCAIANKAK